MAARNVKRAEALHGYAQLFPKPAQKIYIIPSRYYSEDKYTLMATVVL